MAIEYALIGMLMTVAIVAGLLTIGPLVLAMFVRAANSLTG